MNVRTSSKAVLLFAVSIIQLLFLLNITCAQTNVLFIAVDDLRPELGCYGKEYMHTPNIDLLASKGVLFENAFCMVPTCGASRASVMSSRRPAPTRFRNYLTWLSKEVPDATPLHTHFKNNGYKTISIGKIFHHAKDHVEGWTEKPVRSKSAQYFNDAERMNSIANYKAKYPNSKKGTRGPATESADVDETLYGDGESATAAIQKLEQFSKNPAEPFFLAVGFYKPHLQFTAPKKYWDLYDREAIEVAPNKGKPTDVPKTALHTSGELRTYSDIPPTGPINDAKARELIHGYRACVSFMDAQVGRILKKLEESGLSQNTIVVLWSDHGWQLGEHGLWNKHSCFETSMWTPLIISVPGSKDVKSGQRAAGLVELIDLYPTICELANIEPSTGLDGESLVPMLKDPFIEGKQFAIGRYQAGDTIRSKTFRYTEFRGKRGNNRPRGLGKVTGKMLFNHSSDPNEDENVVRKEKFSDIVNQMSAQLNANKGVPYEDD
jgi:arylsulfatase A-like enzyme